MAGGAGGSEGWTQRIGGSGGAVEFVIPSTDMGNALSFSLGSGGNPFRSPTSPPAQGNPGGATNCSSSNIPSIATANGGSGARANDPNNSNINRTGNGVMNTGNLFNLHLGGSIGKVSQTDGVSGGAGEGGKAVVDLLS